MVRLSEIISPCFKEVHKDIKNNGHTHYFIKGGRGSTKSSFVSIEIVQGIMRYPNANGIALRKVGRDLKESVFMQLLWAIDILGVSAYWSVHLSPLRLCYKPTGQMILFRGVDDASKSKSIKLRKGYFKYIWFEEADQFTGMEEIRKVTQSLIRGGENQVVLYTYNPPKSVNNWINTEITNRLATKDSDTSTVIHHSSYLDVPEAWLGQDFIREAERLKATDETSYNHEYLGEVTGTGGEIFKNVTLREITPDEIKALGRVYRGLDFGFSIDPCAYICCCLHNYKLYIFNEFYLEELGFDKMAELITEENKLNDLVYADSAEPRSIHELAIRGIKVSPARKEKGSVEHGVSRLSRDLIEIVIDPIKCPNAAKEFTTYEYERDKDDVFKAMYPDKNNHTIDAVRYALCNTEFMLKPEKKQVKKHVDFDFQKKREYGGRNPENIF